MPIWFLLQTRRSFTRRYRRSYLLDSTKLLIGLSRPRWWEEKLLKLPGSLLTKAGSATLYQLRTFLSRERPCCKNSSLLVSLCQVRFSAFTWQTYGSLESIACLDISASNITAFASNHNHFGLILLFQPFVFTSWMNQFLFHCFRG